jgi:anaerobic magnesium-protoporphyrin IX monomethyl ester cyclase
MIGLVKAHGIRAGTFIMVGYEGETLQDISLTADHLRDAAPDDVLTTLSYPIKGTPYYDKVADRIVAGRAWEDGSDRDLSIRGRNSRRFYSHAQRWLQAEAELGRIGRARARNWRKLVKAKAASAMSRVGMFVSRNEAEHG